MLKWGKIIALSFLTSLFWILSFSIEIVPERNRHSKSRPVLQKISIIITITLIETKNGSSAQYLYCNSLLLT